MSEKIELIGLSKEELNQAFIAIGEKPFRENNSGIGFIIRAQLLLNK